MAKAELAGWSFEKPKTVFQGEYFGFYFWSKNYLLKESLLLDMIGPRETRSIFFRIIFFQTPKAFTTTFLFYFPSFNCMRM